jgi:hypothetical protein
MEVNLRLQSVKAYWYHLVKEPNSVLPAHCDFLPMVLIISLVTRIPSVGSGIRIQPRAKKYLETRLVPRPTQPAIKWVPGLFLRVQNPGCEADHSSHSSAKVKNEWGYTSTTAICLHGMYREHIYDPSNGKRPFPCRPVIFTDWSFKYRVANLFPTITVHIPKKLCVGKCSQTRSSR